MSSIQLIVALLAVLFLDGRGLGTTHRGEDSVSHLVDANTRFALDLYRTLAALDNDNLLCSPHSVSTALAMTLAGARRATAEEMAATLRFGDLPGEPHPAFAALAPLLEQAAEHDGIEITIANRLWGQQGQTFGAPFLHTARVHYGGGFEAVDFAGATESARHAINGWVETRTHERIKTLLQPGDLDRATVLALTNAVYFKGSWLIRFNEQHTKDATFFVGEERPVDVPMMGLTASFPYFASDTLQAVEMPYTGERLSMVILLPRARDGLRPLEASLDHGTLDAWLDGLRPSEVHVILPRFRIEDRFHLEKILPGMGMPLAFTPGGADFSGICGTPGGIWIDTVIHQTFVEVNEAGTEASAATAVILKRGGGPPIIRADHPFMFLIRDRETGTVLFIGRVVDPRGEPSSGDRSR